MYETVSYVVDPDEMTATVSLDRPEKKNAMNTKMLSEIVSAIADAERDDDVRVVVLQGNGDSFSAGYDLARSGEFGVHEDSTGEMGPSVDDLMETLASYEHVSAVWECDKPVIAAVNGYCLAGGTDLALACDLVIASDDAQFGYPGLRLGGVPPRLIHPFVMNLHEVKEVLLTGKVFTARRAEQLGMVNRVVDQGSLSSAVSEDAREITKIPGNNVKILKHVINGVAEMQGFRPMYKYGELFNALAHSTQYSKVYYQMAAEDGFDAVLEHMDEPHKGVRGPSDDDS